WDPSSDRIQKGRDLPDRPGDASAGWSGHPAMVSEFEDSSEPRQVEAQHRAADVTEILLSSRLAPIQNRPRVFFCYEVPMFSISLRNADHIRHSSSGAHESSGWEVNLEEDSELTRRVFYQDWHRVERALASFKHEVSDLTVRGWQIAGDQTHHAIA